MEHPLRLQRLSEPWLPQIMSLDRRSMNSGWSEPSFLQELTRTSTTVLGVVSAEALWGFGICWQILEEAHLSILAIAPEHQGKSLGKWLLWGLLSAAATQRAEWTLLEVRASNQRALNLYHFFGFSVFGQRAKYYADPTEDALLLWRKGLNTDQFQADLYLWQKAIHTALGEQGFCIES
ncbi:MAG: ribosomal protein S18-alanine N-acetyltransferase [Oscillatoriales cyanobacterium SM2_2_1]|nr:ribosomal protein S18-alanine N-acetyltransferase [Oscillatoriales cyanobacterium SM2_2_1]